MAPGTLVFTGEKKMDEVSFSVIHFSEEAYEEKSPKSISEVVEEIKLGKGNVWVNIDGLHDERVIEEVCGFLGVHKLTMEDILNVGQRPKVEEHANYLHFVLRMFMISPFEEGFLEEQLSFVLKDNVLISFQEDEGDVFDGVRKRLRDGKSQIRKRGTDYLLYALLDAVVDHYYVVLESLGGKFEDLEIELLDNPTKAVLAKLHLLRRETINLRRSVFPLREVVGRFARIEEPMVQEPTKVFVRDLYDHTLQVIETIEVLRDIATGLLDLYMNSVSNKMNEIMKVLTIIATIFIPLTFIAGVYGMNFSYMPELTWRYGYFLVMGLMLLAALLMVAYFRRKKWL